MEYLVKILETQYILHDVKHFVVERPKDYDFIPGQATDVSLNLPEWKDNLHPFTFTGLREWDHLDFMIKIYPERHGMTDMLGRINAGAELILHDVFGAIQYIERGVFIAAGAGITPFVAIFRDLYKKHQLKGNKLIYSNKTSDDVIIEAELQKMFKDDFIKIFTREKVIGFLDRRIDRNYLVETIGDFGQHFYVCGPDDFVKDINTHLTELGASSDSIIFEK